MNTILAFFVSVYLGVVGVFGFETADHEDVKVSMTTVQQESDEQKIADNQPTQTTSDLTNHTASDYRVTLYDQDGKVTDYKKNTRSVYFKDQIVVGADPATFRIIEDEEAYDALDVNNKYLRGKLITMNSEVIETLYPYELRLEEDSVRVVNVETNQSITLSVSPEELPVYKGELVGSIGFDNTQRYFVLDTGTSKTRGKVIFDFNSGRILANFCSASGVLFWENHAIYGSCNNFPVNVGWEVGLPEIKVVDLDTGKTNTLLSAKNEEGSYRFMSIDSVENDVLNYESYLVQGEQYESLSEPTSLSLDLNKVLE